MPIIGDLPTNPASLCGFTLRVTNTKGIQSETEGGGLNIICTLAMPQERSGCFLRLCLEPNGTQECMCKEQWDLMGWLI